MRSSFSLFVGALVLAVFMQAPANAMILYSSSFEGTDGGWTASGTGGFPGDWERGVPDPAGMMFVETTYNPPAAAFDGDEVWATVLDGAYQNSGQTSILAQTFDLTSAVAPVSFSWQQHLEAFFDFDTAELTVNGTPLYALNSSTVIPWELQQVDLSPYAGGMATIQFELFASTVVNRAGWYIDSVTLSDSSTASPEVPEPALAGVLGLASLGLVARRRVRV